MPESFWECSTRVYAKPGIAESCLGLQNRYGLDVNLVLLCAWHGYYHGEISAPVLTQILSFAQSWSGEIVQPLRAVRSWMKGKESILVNPDRQYQELRSSVKNIELQAERIQQEQIEYLVVPTLEESPKREPQEAMLKNFLKYLKAINIEAEQEILLQFRPIQQSIAAQSTDSD